MQLGPVARYLNRHPWMMFGTGLAVAGLGAVRIRNRRRERRERSEMEAAREPLPPHSGEARPRRRMAFSRRD